MGIYNPLLSITSMMVLPMSTIYDHPSDMLAQMAKQLGGDGFHTVMCIDAVVILCGGVITAFVGVSGLIKRLAGDRLLPSFLRVTNSRGAAYAAILCFVSLAFSLFAAIFNPSNPSAIDNFGGVYAIAFLTVLTAFGYASCLVKLNRSKMARLVITPWWQVVFSIVCVILGFIGMLLADILIQYIHIIIHIYIP